MRYTYANPTDALEATAQKLSASDADKSLAALARELGVVLR